MPNIAAYYAPYWLLLFNSYLLLKKKKTEQMEALIPKKQRDKQQAAHLLGALLGHLYRSCVFLTSTSEIPSTVTFLSSLQKWECTGPKRDNQHK